MPYTDGTYGGRTLFLEVTATDGVLEGGEWKTTVMVRCGLSNHQVASDIPLIIRCNGDDQGVAGAKSDPQGVFNHDIQLPGPGKHFVSAQVPGTTIEVGDWVTAKAEAPRPKVAKSLRVSVVGPRGDQKLVISIADADGMFIPKTPFLIINPARTDTYETDEDGTVTYPARFTEASRAFEVRAGNTPELVWRGRLLGPKRPTQAALF